MLKISPEIRTTGKAVVYLRPTVAVAVLSLPCMLQKAVASRVMGPVST
jgi:hypothetical protein